MTEDTSQASGSNKWAVLGFLAIALYASFELVRPFLEPIVLAILIGMLTMPMHTWLVAKLNGRETLASIISCLVLTLGIVIPTILVLAAVLGQGIEYSLIVKNWATGESIHQVLQHPWILEAKAWLDGVLPAEALDPEKLRSQAMATASSMGKQFAGVSTSMLGSVTTLAMNFFLLIFVLFFVLRDHDRLVDFIRRALPLSHSQETLLLEEIVAVSKSALMGSLLTAITQGIVGGIGLWMAGISALFWGSIMAVSSLIPVVGTALVWVPAAIYLFVTGETEWGLFMLVWGAVVIGSIDNFLRPVFMQGASMNTVVIFFALLGGIHVFGLIGLVYGPIIVAITLVLLHLYESEFADFLHGQANS